MSDPRPGRNISLLILLLGGAGVAYWALNHSPTQIFPDLVGIAAVIAAQLGIVGMFVYAFDARRYARLKSGRTVIARWELTPAEWHAFVVHNGQRGNSPDGVPFGIPRGHVPRSEPIEVVVGSDSVFIDGDFSSLRHGLTAVSQPIWVEGTPALLEFTLWEPGAHDSSGTVHAVRIPIAAHSRDDARRVAAHYVRVLPPPRKDRSAT